MNTETEAPFLSIVNEGLIYTVSNPKVPTLSQRLIIGSYVQIKNLAQHTTDFLVTATVAVGNIVRDCLSASLSAYLCYLSSIEALLFPHTLLIDTFFQTCIVALLLSALLTTIMSSLPALSLIQYVATRTLLPIFQLYHRMRYCLHSRTHAERMCWYCGAWVWLPQDTPSSWTCPHINCGQTNEEDDTVSWTLPTHATSEEESDVNTPSNGSDALTPPPLDSVAASLWCDMCLQAQQAWLAARANIATPEEAKGLAFACKPCPSCELRHQQVIDRLPKSQPLLSGFFLTVRKALEETIESASILNADTHSHSRNAQPSPLTNMVSSASAQGLPQIGHIPVHPVPTLAHRRARSSTMSPLAMSGSPDAVVTAAAVQVEGTRSKGWMRVYMRAFGASWLLSMGLAIRDVLMGFPVAVNIPPSLSSMLENVEIEDSRPLFRQKNTDKQSSQSITSTDSSVDNNTSVDNPNNAPLPPRTILLYDEYHRLHLTPPPAALLAAAPTLYLPVYPLLAAFSLYCAMIMQQTEAYIALALPMATIVLLKRSLERLPRLSLAMLVSSLPPLPRVPAACLRVLLWPWFVAVYLFSILMRLILPNAVVRSTVTRKAVAVVKSADTPRRRVVPGPSLDDVSVISPIAVSAPVMLPPPVLNTQDNEDVDVSAETSVADHVDIIGGVDASESEIVRRSNGDRDDAGSLHNTREAHISSSPLPNDRGVDASRTSNPQSFPQPFSASSTPASETSAASEASASSSLTSLSSMLSPLMNIFAAHAPATQPTVHAATAPINAQAPPPMLSSQAQYLSHAQYTRSTDTDAARAASFTAPSLSAVNAAPAQLTAGFSDVYPISPLNAALPHPTYPYHSTHPYWAAHASQVPHSAAYATHGQSQGPYIGYPAYPTAFSTPRYNPYATHMTQGHPSYHSFPGIMSPISEMYQNPPPDAHARHLPPSAHHYSHMPHSSPSPSPSHSHSHSHYASQHYTHAPSQNTHALQHTPVPSPYGAHHVPMTPVHTQQPQIGGGGHLGSISSPAERVDSRATMGLGLGMGMSVSGHESRIRNDALDFPFLSSLSLSSTQSQLHQPNKVVQETEALTLAPALSGLTLSHSDKATSSLSTSARVLIASSPAHSQPSPLGQHALSVARGAAQGQWREVKRESCDDSDGEDTESDSRSGYGFIGGHGLVPSTDHMNDDY